MDSALDFKDAHNNEQGPRQAIVRTMSTFESLVHRLNSHTLMLTELHKMLKPHVNQEVQDNGIIT